MSLADELERLARLHSSGSLSSQEFETAKQKLLAGNSVESPLASSALADIHQQNEVAQLDRQWQINRDQYLVHGRYGSRIPTKGSSVAQGMVLGIFGSIWTIMALGMASAGMSLMPGVGRVFALLFPAFGVCFTLFGIFSAVNAYSKAEAYEAAEREYQRQRAELTRKG